MQHVFLSSKKIPLKRFYHYLIFALWSLLLTLNTNSAIAKNKVDDGLEKLVEQLKSLESFSGSFVQFSVDQKGTRIQNSKGEFKAKRPGYFYWHTDEPLEQTIYSDGKVVTVFDPDLEQATVQKIDAQVQTTPAILFSGDTAQIGKEFRVEVKQMDELFTTYLLTPKNKDSLFERLQVRFEGRVLSEMRLTDALGQQSTVSFVQMQVNLDLADAEFVPNLPEGTDIIRDNPAINSPNNTSL